MAKPICTIIAGPNGAGKTTFALKYLPSVAGVRNFINADLIATGLSPLDIDSGQMRASRIFIGEVEKAIQAREDFSFETTLAGKTHVKRVKRMQAEGWQVELIYLYLPSIESSENRVAERVAHGGHDIRLEDIRRRYARSIKNLIDIFMPICDTTLCIDNSESTPSPIFIDARNMLTVLNYGTYEKLMEVTSDA
ncbi:MAG: zeta toxin family protein [Planctomycetes bacterium]|nr:zeta toxin family protein [Planctomycetota bacterium]